ncbi:MAG: hypothetical protein ACRDJP_00530, partial [Actinomycetota bacterium]
MRIRTTGALARLALALIFLAGWMQPASSRDRERDASDEVECKGCVESKDIERGAVEGSDIGKDEVEEEDVREGAITTVEIRDGEVKTPDLADGAVTSEKIGDGEVTTDDIADGTVTTTDIADGTVTNADLGQGSVDTGTIEDETITTADIKNGSISADDLAFDAVTQAELDGRMGFPGSGPVVVDAADQLPIGEAIGVDGLPLIAYSNGGSMYVVHCKTAACDLHDQPVATGGSSFGGVTVAVPGDGRPVVAGDDLWRCADEVCSSFDQVFVGGQISSLVIDVDGLPLFLAGGTLTKCDDPACSTMTTGDNFGNESAVTIGADGSI